MSGANKDSEPERITVLAREFTPAAIEYHRRRMGDRGYELEGRITPRKFQMLESPEAPKELFGGEAYYAVTFVKRS